MAAILLLLFLLLTFTTHHVLCDPFTATATATPRNSFYLSRTTLFSNYDTMLHSFKIFVYAPPSPYTVATVFTTAPESHFYTSLLQSRFVTDDPSQAHLFLIPFPPSLSTRQLARLVRNIRITFPFWNRTLGADHFYLSAAGVDSSSDRNVVELKKNSIQISCFPTSSGLFIPHKDITLPPVHTFQVTSSSPANSTPAYLGYLKLRERSTPSSLIGEIEGDPVFKVEYAPASRRSEFVNGSKFCLFLYGDDMTWMVEAMAARCVPVVISDRPIQDLPLMDVMKWSELAVFVSSGGGAKGLKGVLEGIGKIRYKQMMESGVVATQHLVWNTEPQTHDAFHMILYQLWLRRHTIRYARWAEQ